MANGAEFTIDDTPSSDPVTGDRGYDATPNATVIFQLENTPARDVLSTTFAVYDPAIPDSPLASLDAPLLTFDVSGESTESPDPPTAVSTITLPDTDGDAHSWVVRCTVVKPSGPEYFERMMVLRKGAPVAGGRRKVVVGETSQYESRGWADEWNRLVTSFAPAALEVLETADATPVDAVVFQPPPGSMVLFSALVQASGAGATDRIYWMLNAWFKVSGLGVVVMVDGPNEESTVDLSGATFAADAEIVVVTGTKIGVSLTGVSGAVDWTVRGTFNIHRL